MATHTFTRLQHGYDSGIGWVEGGSTASFLFQVPLGFRFSHDGAARSLWSSLTFTLTYFSGPGGAGTLEIRVIKRRSPPAFSDTHLPYASNSPLELIYSASHTFNSANPTLAVTIPLNTAATGLSNYLGGLLSAYPGQSFGLVLDWSGSNVTWTSSLSATYTRDLTGITATGDHYSRADECPKCGTEGFRENWARDQAGVTRGGSGLGPFVCPSCMDPPSPPRGPRTRLREVNG